METQFIFLKAMIGRKTLRKSRYRELLSAERQRVDAVVNSPLSCFAESGRCRD